MWLAADVAVLCCEIRQNSRTNYNLNGVSKVLNSVTVLFCLDFLKPTFLVISVNVFVVPFNISHVCLHLRDSQFLQWSSLS